MIVAEISGNHGGSLERAVRLVEAAAETGAHAVKLQTFTPDAITLNLKEREFLIGGSEDGRFAGKSLYELYREAQTPLAWHEKLFNRARELGMTAFSSAFDESMVDFLESLGVPAYKIASFENTDLPLIRKAASTGKPLIVSTGMATAEELGETVRCARSAGCRDLILLKCTSSYPSDPEHANLLTIPHMRETYQCPVGLSDHTLGIGTAVAATVLGAVLIEKHFTLSRHDDGIDSAMSMEPEDMRRLVEETRRAKASLGSCRYGPTEQERGGLHFRRSLYVAKDMKAGERFTKENLRSVRPGLGLPPKYYDQILNRPITQDSPTGTPLTWDLVG